MRVFVCAALFALTSAANADLLTNGNFESMPNWNMGIAGDGAYTLFTGNAIPGWTIETGYAVTIHNTAAYPFISGQYSMNTDAEGYNGHNANIYQDFTAAAASVYTLEFDWQNWFSSTAPMLDVSLVDLTTNAVLAHGSYGLLAGTNHETFTFTGTGNALRLRVKHDPESGFNDNTFIADNFAVELVPAPGAAATLGLGGLLLARRRR